MFALSALRVIAGTMTWPKQKAARLLAYKKYPAKRRAVNKAAKKAKRLELTTALKRVSSLERQLGQASARINRLEAQLHEAKNLQRQKGKV